MRKTCVKTLMYLKIQFLFNKQTFTFSLFSLELFTKPKNERMKGNYGGRKKAPHELFIQIQSCECLLRRYILPSTHF